MKLSVNQQGQMIITQVNAGQRGMSKYPAKVIKVSNDKALILFAGRTVWVNQRSLKANHAPYAKYEFREEVEEAKK